MIYEFADTLGRSRWLIQPIAMRRILSELATATHETIQAKIAAMPARLATPEVMGDVAVINVSGPITYRESFWSMYFGSATIERLQAQFRAALADPNVKAILFRIDSPGGTVDMVPEFAAEIFKARGQKPIIAVSDTLMASAAYWIGCQADQVIVSPSSQTGSIGVFTMHEDISQALEQFGVKVSLIFAGEHKVDGNPFEPLPDDVRARIQAEVDDVHADFLSAVGRGRGVSAAEVRKTYGQGLVYAAKDAVKLGLANKVATFEDTLARTIKQRGGGTRAELLDGVTVPISAAVDGVLEVATEFEAAMATAAAASNEPAPEATDEAQLVADRDYAEFGLRIAELE